MEQEGYIRILERRLAKDSDAMDRFLKSHKGYAKERWNGLKAEHQDFVLKSESMTKVLKFTGVAGTDLASFSTKDSTVDMNSKMHIKCLHAHYAHYRSQRENTSGCDYPLNIVGQWIHKLLQERHDDLVL